MKRREFVAAAVSAACVGAVGASRADEFESAERSRGTAAASASDESADDAMEGDSGGGSVEEASSTLEVTSTTSGLTHVRLRLVRVSDGATVHDRVRSFEYGERAYLTGLCEPGETYAFSLGVDGSTLVRETVSPGETVVFELLDENTVSVVA